MSRQLKFGKEPSDDDLNQIAERAKALQPRLAALTSPVIIEFSGSPKSGKSTNIDIINHFFRRNELRVWAPTEGASKRTPYILRKDLVAFNAWSLNYAISELLLSYHNVDTPHLVILDRGPFDSLAWMGVLRERNELSSEEYDIIRNFALHPKWAGLIDRIYLFSCEPRTSLNRENSLKLTVRSGIAMNAEMLTQLGQQYATLATVEDGYPVVTVSTDGTENPGPKSSAFAIVSDLLDCFEEKLGGGK